MDFLMMFLAMTLGMVVATALFVVAYIWAMVKYGKKIVEWIMKKMDISL